MLPLRKAYAALPEPDRVLATVLFIDIVGSTEKAAVVGDRRWTEVLNHYYAAVRRELRASREREVNTTGNGNARHVRRASRGDSMRGCDL